MICLPPDLPAFTQHVGYNGCDAFLFCVCVLCLLAAWPTRFHPAGLPVSIMDATLLFVCDSFVCHPAYPPSPSRPAWSIMDATLFFFLCFVCLPPDLPAFTQKACLKYNGCDAFVFDLFVLFCLPPDLPAFTQQAYLKYNGCDAFVCLWFVCHPTYLPSLSRPAWSIMDATLLFVICLFATRPTHHHPACLPYV